MIERRSSRRYELALPIKIRTPFQSDTLTCSGRTRDISTRGGYFTVESDLNVGAELDVMVTLPAEVTGGIEVMVHAKSTVLRVDRSSESGDRRVGVAAQFARCEIVRTGSART